VQENERHTCDLINKIFDPEMMVRTGLWTLEEIGERTEHFHLNMGLPTRAKDFKGVYNLDVKGLVIFAASTKEVMNTQFEIKDLNDKH